jgi:hypothetical protein
MLVKKTFNSMLTCPSISLPTVLVMEVAASKDFLSGGRGKSIIPIVLIESDYSAFSTDRIDEAIRVDLYTPFDGVSKFGDPVLCGRRYNSERFSP